MSERYSKLFFLPEKLYATGSPVLIAAGTLLKDNQTGKVLAQLKIQNIGMKSIKAVKVCILPQDTIGNSLGSAVEFQYLDLNIARDDTFGTKQPITFPDTQTRAYSVSVTEVVFTDNSVWKDTGEIWTPLTSPDTLESFLKGTELIRQYRIKFGDGCKYKPTVEKNLWYCTCGALNHAEEAHCHRCNNEAEAVMHPDLDALKGEIQLRLAEDAKKAEQQKQAAEQRSKKKKKIAIILAPIVILLIVIAVFAVKAANDKKAEAARAYKYDIAVSLLDEEKYEGAYELLTQLGEYKDCKELLLVAEEGMKEQKYISALLELANGNDEKAYTIFQELGDYKDAALYQYEYLLSSEVYTFAGDNYTVHQETKYRYDLTGQLLSSGYFATPESQAEVTEYSYDDAGNRKGFCETYWTYDMVGNPKRNRPWTIESEYNEHGDIVKSTSTRYEILADGTKDAVQTTEYIYTYSYDSYGSITDKTTAMTTTSFRAENEDERVHFSELTVTYEYEYSDDGKILTSTSHESGGKSFVYEYSYDEFGNIISKTSGKNVTTYEYTKQLVKQH